MPRSIRKGPFVDPSLLRKVEKLNDLSELSDAASSVKPTDKLGVKNRKVLKGHFAKIYAMHWADSEGEG